MLRATSATATLAARTVSRCTLPSSSTFLPLRSLSVLSSSASASPSPFLRSKHPTSSGGSTHDSSHPSRVPESAQKGLLTLPELEKWVEAGRIDTVCAVFPDHYGRLVGKRFDAEFFLASVAKGGTHGCNYLLVVDMEMNPRDGFQSANWATGFGDYHLVPDLTTIRHASWLNKTAIVICDLQDQGTHQPVPQAPRSILKRQLELAKGNLNAKVIAASELEYYVYKNPFDEARQLGYANLRPISSYVEDYHILQCTREEPLNAAARQHLKASGVPVECTKGEAGRGQHELNVLYNEALKMADSHMMLKQCVKEVADSLNWSVTFMAKPHETESGSSCHIHLNLVDDTTGHNLFDGTKASSSEHLKGIQCSNHFRWFLGGWMKHLPELMPFYAPTVNSYKRFQAASWAPTRIAWSTDNRTAGFRVVGAGRSLRIECRIPGADCNPYLGFAAAVASGLDGIANRIEPPPAFNGDAYSASAESSASLPTSLHVAIDKFKSSEFAKRAFGEDVVYHYAHHLQLEWNAFQKSVTDWELRRYFEQI